MNIIQYAWRFLSFSLSFSRLDDSSDLASHASYEISEAEHTIWQSLVIVSCSPPFQDSEYARHAAGFIGTFDL